MKKIAFKHYVREEIISGIILQVNQQAHILPSCIFIHGGGSASYKERIIDFTEPIFKENINILSFDFSGHGESTGTLATGSLERRVIEAQEIIKHYSALQALTIFGASMGGYIAIKLLELFPINTLILFCPALYDVKAYEIPFDKGFTEIIRSFESWRNTDVLKILEKFTGKLLIIMGSEDQVIPEGVIELIMKHATRVNKKELYIIPQCSHQIHTWLESHPEDLKRLHQKINEYL